MSNSGLSFFRSLILALIGTLPHLGCLPSSVIGGAIPMGLLEDAFKGRSLDLTGLGLLALVLPLGIPSLRKGWESVLAEGVKLYLEASGEAEIELVDDLAEFTLGQPVQALAKPKDEHEERVEHVIAKYKKRARARSSRWARTEARREARYQQHIIQPPIQSGAATGQYLLRKASRMGKSLEKNGLTGAMMIRRTAERKPGS
ncbi:MAG: hypothetical protein EKK29_20150 [Hyphomicrobiales bacterium]|nr:MAG: hypothetical protein EKK29_20150 [Hyphomicrobiales bacterium]